MLRLLVASFLLVATGLSVHAETYTISAWPKGIQDLPCAAFRKEADGTWTLIAVVQVEGGPTLKTMNLDGSPEGTMVEAQCGEKKEENKEEKK